MAIADWNHTYTVPQFAVRFAAGDEPFWCRHKPLRDALDAWWSTLDD